MRREAHAAERVPRQHRPESGLGEEWGEGNLVAVKKFARGLSALRAHQKEVRKLHHHASLCMYMRVLPFY